MTTLEQSLHKHDIGHLRIIAQFWGVALRAGERNAAREELSEKLLSKSLSAEVIESLRPESRLALNALLENDGRIPWAIFVRQFGDLREIGAGKRDREKIYLNPISAAETLFYCALLARAFFDSPSGAQEFAYIPDDLLKIIHDTHSGAGEHEVHKEKPVLGRLARPDERAHLMLANDHILDDLTTLLAALRLGWDDKSPLTPLDTSPRFARDLMLAARLLIDEGLEPSAVKSHLEQSRVDSFAKLRNFWQESKKINELHQIPTLICEGEWANPILSTREAIFGFLEEIPRGKWWSLKAFIEDIKEKNPDFQRRAGDYDAWFIRRAEDDAPLRGFEHWDEVEGALIRYFITGVLYWLGIVDLASAKEDGEITAFRVREDTVPEWRPKEATVVEPIVEGRVVNNLSSPYRVQATVLPIGRSAQKLGKEEKGKINVSSNGQITISRFAPRVARYQISRFCEWGESKNPDEYRYQITPSSLERAREQGLKVSHLLGLLKKFAAMEIPPTLGSALRRWEVSGTEARVETLSVLRLSKPEDLRALRESKAGRFLGEVLGPTTVVVKDGAFQKIMSTLIEMGILMKDESER